MSANSDKVIFRLLIAATIFTLGFGTVFFHIVEKWSWLDAYYYSVITLTTVGYGDFSPETRLGRFVATIYIFVGVGIIALFIQNVVKRRGSKFVSKHTTDKLDSDK